MAADPSSKKDAFLFYCEIRKGFTFKSAIDVLAGFFLRSTFSIREDRFFHRNMDEAQHVLFDLDLPREKFKKYIYTKDIDFEISLKQFRAMTKTIKRKDVILVYIKKSEPERLYIATKPVNTISKTTSHKDLEILKKQAKKERSYDVSDSTINVLPESGNYMEISTPDFIMEQDGTMTNIYSFPTVINSLDFSRVKTLTSHGKVLRICMKGNDYISFYSNNNGLSGRMIHVGDENISDEDEENGEPVRVYEEEFHMAIIHLLIKLPCLAAQMQFYAPVLPLYPLKISLDAGEIGTISVYIKDNKRIAIDDTVEKTRKFENDDNSDTFHSTRM